MDTRLPFPVPFGWFRIGDRNELAPGSLSRQRYFGRELVWWRDSAGVDSLVDAHCPHLGAHFGYGGRVEGDRLACPFHGWQFDGTGSCIAIPYARRIPPGVHLRSYPVCVRGPVDARNDVDGWGPGFSITRFSGIAVVLAFGMPTPIEDGKTRMHFSFVARNPERDPKIERVAEAFVTETVRQLEQDKLIWENKCFRERPPLLEAEAGIPRFRKWYQHFYAS